jgi:hypothetical protein
MLNMRYPPAEAWERAKPVSRQRWNRWCPHLPAGAAPLNSSGRSVIAPVAPILIRVRRINHRFVMRPVGAPGLSKVS